MQVKCAELKLSVSTSGQANKQANIRTHTHVCNELTLSVGLAQAGVVNCANFWARIAPYGMCFKISQGLYVYCELH